MVENENDPMVLARKQLFIIKGTPLHRTLMEITTGEQAISFFAKHGNNTPIKIVNCNAARVHPMDFRPYDLTVVHDENDLDPEYYTISAQGVVAISRTKKRRSLGDDDEEQAYTELFKLSDWMQQSTKFNVLTSMKVFKHNIISKIFSQWKGNVRHKKFLRTRQKLGCNLIFSHQSFWPCFHSIHKTLLKMSQDLTFTVAKQGRLYMMDEYMKEQRTERENTKSLYNHAVDGIIEQLNIQIAEVLESPNISVEEDLDTAKIGQ